MKRVAAIFGGLAFALPIVCLAAASWPISSANLKITRADYRPVLLDDPYDCQPELFDPRTTPYRLSKTGGNPPEGYIVGEDDYPTMMIDGWFKQGEDKTILPKPFSLTKYEFGCASTSSRVFEIKKDNVRHALYTHISQARFSPSLKTIALYNYVKNARGKWQSLRRIIDLTTKRSIKLPVVDCTTYLADVTNDRVVTYGSSVDWQSQADDQRRIVCVWDYEGRLQKALKVPLTGTSGNSDASSDAVGVLPAQSTTLYHLTGTNEGVCTLSLHSLAKDTHRTVKLTVPGASGTGDSCSVGTALELDLKGLTLQGGSMKYRVSTSGRGDLDSDWGSWQTAK